MAILLLSLKYRLASDLIASSYVWRPLRATGGESSFPVRERDCRSGVDNERSAKRLHRSVNSDSQRAGSCSHDLCGLLRGELAHLQQFDRLSLADRKAADRFPQ